MNGKKKQKAKELSELNEQKASNAILTRKFMSINLPIIYTTNNKKFYSRALR